VSQAMTVKTGICEVKEAILPNPVTLQPFRTFPEIEQPESKFIFRARKGERTPSFALFEADGMAWESTAMLTIKEYLQEAVEGLLVLA